MELLNIKPIATYSARELSVLILSLIGAGTLIIALLAAPGLGVMFRYFGVQNPKMKRKLLRKMQTLERSGYIAKTNRGYALSEKGKHLLTEDEVWNLKPPPLGKWNGEWHMVLFDIPAKKERARQALRARLGELGYKPYQNSVFVHKQDLRPLVEKFSSFYGVRGNVRFITATKIL